MSKIALFTPNNRLPWTEALSNWTQSNVTVFDASTVVLAPDGTETATKVMETGASSANHSLFSVASGFIGEPVRAEFFWRYGERPQFRFDVFERYGGRVLVNIEIDSISLNAFVGYVELEEDASEGWRHVIVASSLTVATSDGGNGGIDYGFYTMNGSGGVTYTGTSGSGIYVWHPNVSPGVLAPYIANTASIQVGNCVIPDTEWDSTSGAEKYFDESKTPAGARTRYVYGQRERYRLNAEFLSARDVEIINGWWRNGTPILMRDADDPFAAITSLFIADDSPPVAKLIKPYDDKWSISIDLEGY